MPGLHEPAQSAYLDDSDNARVSLPKDISRSSRVTPHIRLKHLISRLDSASAPGGRNKSWRVDEGAFQTWLIDNAINGLERRFNGASAQRILTRGQRVALAVTLALISVALLFFPLLTLQSAAAVATLFFGLVVALRVIACINLLAALPMRFLRKKPTQKPDAELPVYTLLIPLFREANVLEDLTRALIALDYPPDKLDIKLVLESTDRDTIKCARALELPPHFQIVIVPDAPPRTKPKALNFAMQMARGEFVVVYDAEDRPHPAQLRDALAAFAAGPSNLACLQARLTIYNGPENWLTNGIR